jgi:selenide,water dikinase
MGVTDVVSLQAFLAYPSDIPEEIPVGILRGMNDFMSQLGASVSGGQTIKNPVPVFGGIALGVAHPKDIVYSSGAKPGDSVILTKPLGIQPAMRSYRDLLDDKRDALLEAFSESELARMQDVAVRLMTKSNLEVAEAMRKVNAHAATDITGFGLLGHAGNVAALSCVDIVLERIPVIRGTLELADFFGHRLSQGFGAETAGGMLVFMKPEKTDQFIEFLQAQNLPSWTLGYTKKPVGDPSASFVKDLEFIEADFP